MLFLMITTAFCQESRSLAVDNNAVSNYRNWNQDIYSMSEPSESGHWYHVEALEKQEPSCFALDQLLVLTSVS